MPVKAQRSPKELAFRSRMSLKRPESAKIAQSFRSKKMKVDKDEISTFPQLFRKNQYQEQF